MATLFSVSLLVFPFLLVECYRYMGCYKENTIQSRRMGDLMKNFPGTLTPDICVSHCEDNKFRYAGLQAGQECFCSIERISYKFLADEDDCNSACHGDDSKMCGGLWRLSVYDIQVKSVNYVQSQYIGCYADDGVRGRALSDKEYVTFDLTPEYCAGYCFNYGFRYSGVQYRKQCFCGNEIKGQKAIEDECDFECAGDSRLICGGSWRSSVYRVNSSQPEISVSMQSIDSPCTFVINVYEAVDAAVGYVKLYRNKNMHS